MSTQDKQRLGAILKAQGYYIDIDKWPKKMTFYKQSGEPMPNMPSDPWSMERYLRKGFTLIPPVQPSNGGGECKCDCGFIAKSEFGLKAHIRKHERESKNGE